MTAISETPRRPMVQDVGALIGLLAVLENEIWAADAGGDEIPEWAEHLARRLVADGLLLHVGGNQQLRRALGDLNQRLRYVAGEHDDPHRTS